ncbi:MAG: hypothetical protein RIC55_01135 [Pirellulaceae bacterium]
MFSTMNRAHEAGDNSKTITTCSPGSAVAQQYRVQYRAAPQSIWKLFAACRQREQAQQCLEQLAHQGYSARMVTYRLPPVSV